MPSGRALRNPSGGLPGESSNGTPAWCARFCTIRGVHDAIISRGDWEAVQKTFRDTKYRKPLHMEKNMFCGYLKYSGCGVNLNYIHP